MASVGFSTLPGSRVQRFDRGSLQKVGPRLPANPNFPRRPGAGLPAEACRLCQIRPFADRVFAKLSGPLGVVRSLARFCLASLAPLGTAGEIFGELMSQGNRRGTSGDWLCCRSTVSSTDPPFVSTEAGHAVYSKNPCWKMPCADRERRA
jgi:hypothetical protein